MPWFVLYTKPRNEKKVSLQLNSMGIETYCPTIKKKRNWSDRIKIIEEPLFTSYCFVNIAENERQKVFAAHGVVRYLFWLSRPAIVKEEEINTIKLWLNEFDHSSISTQSFTIEDRIILKNGALMGKTGKVYSIQDKKLLLIIEDLGLMVTVDTRNTSVEKISALA